MTITTMPKLFRVFYIVNLALLLGALTSPFVYRAIASPSYDVEFGEFVIAIGLAPTLCVTFLVMNAYAALKFTVHRMLHAFGKIHEPISFVSRIGRM